MKKGIILFFVVFFISSFGTLFCKIIKNDSIAFTSLFRTTSDQNGGCFRIPVIATAPNGDLIAAIDERVPSCGDLKWNQDINIVIRRSFDQGQNWSDLETIVDYPFGESASDPSIIVDHITGELFLFFNYMDLIHEKDVYYFKVMKSKDNGKTWSLPEDITSQISKPEWEKDFKFITSGKGIQTRSGKLLNTIVNINKGLFVFGSDNHGSSWYLIDTPIKPADESIIVEWENGIWMINSRVNGAGTRYIHLSSDEGKSWFNSFPDTTLIDPGCNASLIKYTSIKDGDDRDRLLFSNAKMKDNRSNMTVRISYDGGKTWSEGKTIYAGSSAYSSLCVLKNGEIGLFFEKDDYKDNVFVRFTLEWLTDGMDK